MNIQAAEQNVIDMMSGRIEVGKGGYDIAILKDLAANGYPFAIEPFKKFASYIVNDNGGTQNYSMYQFRVDMKRYLGAK
jgi:hypothetical protein